MINSISILGGGTSGLVTALILKKWYVNLDVKVIESSTVGIVGVGEGSTEHWARFMQAVGIEIKELISETRATFKTGIKFDNWNGDDKFYMHALHASYTELIPNGMAAIMVAMMSENAEHLTSDGVINSKHYLPLQTTVNQFHFDTFKLNEFLHKKCVERGIIIIDADIVDVELDQQGYVNALIDKEQQKYHSDFFVDCSGFAKLIGTKLGAKWIDCGDQLPMNSAFAFPTARQEDIPSHTLSRALSSGWNWRIPTQDRFGNGYVFCDEFITEGQAIDELQKYYTEPINVGRSFKFSAGYTDKFWIKNCLSLGLAGSFVEPLEASSIGTSLQQAFAFASVLPGWNRGQELIANNYNLHFEEVAKNIIDFVQLHYITNRDDSEFWRSCKTIKLTDFNKETLDYFKNHIPNRSFFTKPFLLFTEQNWLQVMYGLKLFNSESINTMWRQQDPVLHSESINMINNAQQFQNNSLAFSHRDALEYLMSRNYNE
jgi:tryptophan halogenase